MRWLLRMVLLLRMLLRVLRVLRVLWLLLLLLLLRGRRFAQGRGRSIIVQHAPEIHLESRAGAVANLSALSLPQQSPHRLA